MLIKYANKQINNERGQVLLLTILVTVIVLTLAVAAARRTTIDIRQLNAAAESNRALTAAEAGVEDILLALKNGVLPESCGIMDAEACALAFGGSSVSSIDVSTLTSLSLSNVPAEQTVEVTLFNPLTNEDFNGKLDITWEVGSAIAITIILRDSSVPPNYYLYREAFNCGNFAPDNGFNVVLDDDNDGLCRITNIDIAAVEALYPGSIAISMRIRPMYQNTSISVSGFGGDNLPTQAFSVISIGTSGDSQRTIQATRTNEALPSIFDFVLFNGSTTNPLTSSNGTSWFQFQNGDIHSSAGGGININVPAGSMLCVGQGGCVFTSAGGIGTGSGGVSDDDWQQGNYGADFPIERFSYDALLGRLSAKVLATGTSLPSIQGTLNTCGLTTPNCIVRITGSSGTAVIDTNSYNALSTKPVVVFVGNGIGESDVHLEINVAEFVGKNVVFIVSGDVVLTPVVNTLEAGVIFDGLYTVRDN